MLAQLVQFACYGMSRFEKFKNQIPLNHLLIKGHINKAKVSSFALVENISNCLSRETNNKTKVPLVAPRLVHQSLYL